VVVKTVVSQGRPLREGSVLPDFDDPRYAHRPIPPVPVPSWSEPSSKSGKRPAEEYDDQFFEAYDFPDVKRQRLSNLADADGDDDVVQSVEQVGPLQGVEFVPPNSQTIIHDSQSSPREEVFQPLVQPPVLEYTSALFQHSDTSASRKDHLHVHGLKADQMSESSTDLPLPKSRKPLLYDPNHDKTQALLTPPSDASKRKPNGETRSVHVHGSKIKSSPTQATSSSLRRPGTVRKSIYDMEASDDIECSEMSPNSKLAAGKKLSRSSSGSKGSATGSRVRKEMGSLDIFAGTVPNSEVVKLMEDGGVIQPESAKRPRKTISYSSQEYNFRADEDVCDQQVDAPQVRKASVARSHPPNATTYKDESGTRKDVNAVPEETTMSKGRQPTTLTQIDAVPPTTKPLEQTSPGDRSRRRRKKSQIASGEFTEPHNLDTTQQRLDAKQSTPIDSPGEQLLEMQTSSQKSGQDSLKNDLKKTKKQSKIEQKRQEAVAGTAMISATTLQLKGPQKPGRDYKTKAVNSFPTVDVKVIKERARSDSAPKSPYARASPPEGSVGLGFTNSPRRSSIVSRSGSSFSPRRLFQEQPASTKVLTSDDLKETGSSHDSSDASSDESTEAALATPSKPPPPEKAQTPYQKFIARPKQNIERQEAINEATSNKVTAEPALRSNSPVVSSVTLPKGMTLEQYEAKTKQFKDALPKTKATADPKVKKELEARAERAVLARASSKGSTSSVAPSEQPQAKIKPKKSAVAKDASLASTTSAASKQASKTPEGPAQKRAASSATKSAVIVSESSKSSESARAKTTQAAAASKSKAATLTTDPGPGNRLKHLKHKIASRSARSSPAPLLFATSTKPIIKGFNALDEDSEDDSDSGSDEDNDKDEEEKRVNVIKAAKPDQSTRSAVINSDEDTDDSSEDDED
jgi:hypothetical protein